MFLCQHDSNMAWGFGHMKVTFGIWFKSSKAPYSGAETYSKIKKGFHLIDVTAMKLQVCVCSELGSDSNCKTMDV